MLKDRLAGGELLDAEDLAILGEELDRLSQLGGRLRQLSRTPFEKVTCSPRVVVEAALGGADAGELALELDLPPASLTCDPAVLGRGLRELIDNALEARSARAGVRFVVDEGAASGLVTGFCVWDDGPGLELPPAQAMAWGATTRPGAAGLGLTLALRAARAHGFRLELRRDLSQTHAWITIPARVGA
jgi:signal transduction histidine kinase